MRAPETLPIEFVVVGGGVAGLTSAIALSRVGHKVTILEQRDDFQETILAGGCRFAPNTTRIFYRWGLEEELRKISIWARYVQFSRYESGEVVAKGEWVHDFKVESDGEFIQMQYGAFRKLLYETALKYGVTVRANSKVTSVNIKPEAPSVTLESGEEIVADVIIGADGCHSLSRQVMFGEQDYMKRKNIVMYNTVVPVEKMAAVPELVPYLERDKVGMVVSWFGDRYGVMGFPSQGDVYNLHVYTPETTPMPIPVSEVDSAHLVQAMNGCDPHLRKMAELATQIYAVPIVERPHLDDWLHEDGPFLAIGEAAHPLSSGSIYALSLAAADGMMLGRLFYHLRRKDQIPVFLAALSEMRHKRVQEVWDVQSTNPAAMSMPPGVEHSEGLAAAEAMGDGRALTMTQDAIRAVFAYDPEDEADNWLVQWGLMRERTQSEAPLTFAVAIAHQNEQTEG